MKNKLNKIINKYNEIVKIKTQIERISLRICMLKEDLNEDKINELYNLFNDTEKKLNIVMNKFNEYLKNS
jgi:hypothetical protein